MKDIVIARIDDRLIHGQVVTAWLKCYDAKIVLVIDDELAKDAFMQKILQSAAPQGILVETKSTEDALAYLREDSKDNEKYMILTKGPEPLEILLNGGIALTEIILGGMGAKTGRKKFNKNISASDGEVDCMRRLQQLGAKVKYQLVPDERAVPLDKLL